MTAVRTPYRAPSVKPLEAPVVTACGPAGPEHLAFYCPAEEAIYYSPAGLDEHRRRIGDFAPIVVMAHEWGHHLQTVLGVAPSPGNRFELQADCLAGAYAADADQRVCIVFPWSGVSSDASRLGHRPVQLRTSARQP